MIRKSEYRKVNLVISLTMIVWFVTGLIAANVFAPEMVPIVIVGTGVLGVVILALVLYARVTKMKGGEEYYDERSDVCSLKATRNAFVVCLIFLCIYMVLGAMKPDSLYRIQALQGVFGMTVGAYVLSYFYYLYTN